MEGEDCQFKDVCDGCKGDCYSTICECMKCTAKCEWESNKLCQRNRDSQNNSPL